MNPGCGLRFFLRAALHDRVITNLQTQVQQRHQFPGAKVLSPEPVREIRRDVFPYRTGPKDCTPFALQQGQIMLQAI